MLCLNRWYLILLSSVVFLVHAMAPAQEKSAFGLILELSWDDTETIPHDEIIKRCSEVLANREKHTAVAIAEALARRGEAYARLRRFDDAITDLDALCRLNPKAAKPRIMQAATLAAMGKIDDALTDAKEAISLEPKYAPAHVALGFLLLTQGSLDEAAAAAKKATQLDREYGKATYLRALIAHEKGDLKESLSLVNRYLEQHPIPDIGDRDHPYNLRGWIVLRQNRPSEALSNFLLARKLNPDSVSALQNIYLACEDMQKWHVAAKAGEQLTRLRPNNMDSHLFLAHALAKIGEQKLARASLEEALRVAPPVNPAWENAYCGKVYFLIGENANAKECIDRALKTDLDCGPALFARVTILSTCADERFRNGAEALRLAKAYQDNEKRRWGADHYRSYLLLADAAAECGEFSEALKHLRKGIALAGPDRNVRELHERAKLFENKKTHRHKPAETNSK